MSTLDIGHAILTFASLSFLGLGPPPEIPEGGSMIASGRSYLDQWWISTFPGRAILSIVVPLNVMSDRVRDLLDPRFRKGGCLCAAQRCATKSPPCSRQERAIPTWPGGL